MRRAIVHVLVGVLVFGTGIQLGASLGAPEGAWAAAGGNQGPGKQRQTAEVGLTERWVVEFDTRADLAGARQVPDRRARGRFVHSRLVATAERSQAEALALVAGTRGANARSHWLRNVMIVEGTTTLAGKLSRLPGVREVRKERVYPLVEPVPVEGAVLQAVADPEWGVSRIGADSVWEQGILGGGVVVASIDTGVEYTHPALVEQYRGNLGAAGFAHDYNWWDPTGICGPQPCDNAGHGTHTMGTMVGGDGPGPYEPDIGVAPAARWIAAKGCEDFSCTEGALLSSGEFVLAPTDLSGDNPDPGRAPHIVNNSWGGGPGDEFYLETVQAWRAAGIIPVFASGNPGPGCGDGGSPGDYAESLSVGATDSDDVIADFSGRGPSDFGKINPDVSAPGVHVLSSVPGDGFEVFSGTSMAAPHVAGALALMLSAQPDLAGNVGEAAEVLKETALGIVDPSCGGDETGVPNNVYGYGRIDAAAAVDLVATGGTLTGTVTDANTGAAIGGSRVTATGPARTSSTFSRSDGTFRLFLPAGTYVVTAGAFGYETGLVADVDIVTDETVTVDLALTPLPRFTVSGVVRSAENGDVIAAATVRAVGTPLPAVTTDRRGRYRIVLPLGVHTLEASKGGCMQRFSTDVEVTRTLTQDLPIARKLDRFGHGCDPVKLPWANVKDQTTLYGDDVYGRLRLPFAFPFYGQRYEAVFIDSNGYLAFQDPFFSEFFNTGIPNAAAPNAAVYPLWQDLVVDEESFVDYALTGAAAIIEYRNVRLFDGDGRGDVQVKLHRDGTIDMLYGDGVDTLGGGRRATIGLESSNGADAFQFGFREGLVAPGSAYRYTRVATSLIRGTVTNANDGLPVAGATVVSAPGGQNARTGPDGSYELRVIHGSYTVEASAKDYVSGSGSVSVARNGTVTLDFSLKAARAEVTPAALSSTVEIGGEAVEEVTVTNTGSSPLTFQVRERDFGGTPPDLPPVEVDGSAARRPEWAPARLPAGLRPQVAAAVACSGDLDVVIDDPAGDAVGAVDVTTVRGGSDGATVSLALDFTDSTPMNQLSGFIHLDTDQDPATGLPPDALFGMPTQDIGFDYFVDLFELPFEPIVLLWNATTFELEAVLPAAVEGKTVCFDMPSDIFGPDHDGTMDLTMVVGDFFGPTDWAPDIGHGTVEPFRDAPWMAADPAEATLAPGESQVVEVTLGGEGIGPGTYAGVLVFQTNDPRSPRHDVEVTLEVTLPADFGGLGGIVTDEFAGIPVAGVTIFVEAQRGGEEYPVTGTTDDSGGYLLFAPEGTWPVEASAEGFATATTEVTIVAGRRASLDVVLTPILPRAVIEGGPLAFAVEAGEGESAGLLVRNTGLADLEFTVGERPLAGGVQQAAAPLPSGTTSRTRPAARPTRRAAARQAGTGVLVLMDALPWESTALLEVLDASGVEPDVAGRGAMGSLDLDPYDVVVVSNDQPQSFYNAYKANLGWFEDFVASGGLLWVGTASLGWNGGSLDGAVLPGGVAILEEMLEDLNVVVDPGHPAMAGVANPFPGDFASHSAFAGLLPATTVVAAGMASGLPTLIEYPFGEGQVLATAQPLEFGFDFGQPTGTILANLGPYVTSWVRLGDVPWLSAEPAGGTLPPGEEQAVLVTVDSSGLEPGIYAALLVFRTNDPYNRRLLVEVTMQVTNSGG